MSELPFATKLKHAQEIFVLLIVEQDHTAVDAYRKAYPLAKETSLAQSASRLLKNAKVQTRIKEIEQRKALEARAASRITVDFITRELAAVARQATVDKQHSAASQALMGIAKIHGMLVDKHVVDAVVRKPSAQPNGPDEMSELEWLKEYGPTITLEASDSIDILPEEEP
jgi:hypothetical protein